ncbi:MarR family transcriptional regulator [Haloarcula laminariae]|uniref:MarR family transcriptional regulator n=1 Tax=Haloarcula laminariae TaxID=2961577 RepID=UPI0024054F43|nr:helix-turn-helix domain-containing protein [Halomicroarcula sp. FL173]
MPVDFEQYRQHRDGSADLPVDPDSNAYAILAFLTEHPDLGFKPSEIGDEVNIPPGSLNPTLARLEDRGLVEHEPPYWSAAADDRLAAVEGTLFSMEAFEAHYGEDDFSGWHESDVDPREQQ